MVRIGFVNDVPKARADHSAARDENAHLRARHHHSGKHDPNYGYGDDV